LRPWRERIWIVGLAGLIIFSTFSRQRVQAAQVTPPGPDRADVVTVDYTSYKWWLADWEDSQAVCEMFIDHDGLPTYDEVYKACGSELYNSWVSTQPCEPNSYCEGYYLYFVDSAPASKTVGVSLPPVEVFLSLNGCTLESYTYICKQTPVLVLTAEELLPNESILNVAGRLDGESFTCKNGCEIQLKKESPTNGMQLDFWASSSYGDSSELYSAKVRVIILDDTTTDDRTWYVDILSNQMTNSMLASCSQTWGAFPPIQGVPDWLNPPVNAAGLASNLPYELLARNLIKQGMVDVSGCPDSGISLSGEASLCGLAAAQSSVEKWQNRFDNQIFSVAAETGIPARLLKNLFSRESQFWPGIVSEKPEMGLGQLTLNGADTTLLWNSSFYDQFCRLVLIDSACQKPYAILKPEYQVLLQNALVRSVNAYCEDCPLGLNLELANTSVHTFAETLLANCEQTGVIVENTYKVSPGQVSNYVDLWKFTLINYNAGSGCLILALRDTQKLREPVDWEHVSSHLTPPCIGAYNYVRDIGH
jgi:hypothetical protein